jgi:hypothetical protein
LPAVRLPCVPPGRHTAVVEFGGQSSLGVDVKVIQIPLGICYMEDP